MKRTIIAFLIIVTLSVGCSGGTEITEKPVINEKPDVSPTDIPENHDPAEYLLFLTVPYYQSRYYSIEEWQEYIREKHGIEIMLSYGMNIGKLGGFDPNSILLLNYHYDFPYGSQNNSDVLEYNDEHKVYDLTPYYDRYGWRNFIDDKYIDALTMGNNIFAVPSVPDKYVIPRYYNKRLLDELTLDVPTTISEFHEFLLKSKELEADETFYPIVVNRASTQYFADIFRAYGVYVNSQFDSMFTFNPKTGTYEDAVFAPDFQQSMEFIRTLQQEELLGIIGNAYNYDDSSDNRNYFISSITDVKKEFASEYFNIYKADNFGFNRSIEARPSYDYEQGYYLTHTNTENVCELRSNLAFYVFPKTIKDIEGTMELFSEVMTDPGYYYDLTYGIENENYVADMTGVEPLEPMVGGWPQLRQIYPSDDIVYSGIPESLQYLSSLSETLVFEKNVFNQYFTYRERKSSGTTSNYSEPLFYPFITVPDAIEQYKKDFALWGGYENIAYINERIGMAPSYNYGN